MVPAPDLPPLCIRIRDRGAGIPLKDGFEVCRVLRRAGVRTPILMLTAKTQEAEKVMGLDLGADDYLTKPYGRHELRARVRALIHRGSPPLGARGRP